MSNPRDEAIAILIALSLWLLLFWEVLEGLCYLFLGLLGAFKTTNRNTVANLCISKTVIQAESAEEIKVHTEKSLSDSLSSFKSSLKDDRTELEPVKIPKLKYQMKMNFRNSILKVRQSVDHTASPDLV